MNIIHAVISVVLGAPLLSQEPEYNLQRFSGNKVVLLGEWKAEDRDKWTEVAKTAGIYEHGFILLDRQRLMYGIPSRFIGARDIESFERWFRQRYGLTGSARWAALDNENKLAASGVQIPAAVEFSQTLEQRGFKNPLRKVRDFLRENPDHLDAKTDLLEEARSRALGQVPANISEDLDAESDLRTWAVMADETDKVFGGSWLGMDIFFFRPDQGQPEKYSKLMKAVFRKHISKVESALRLDPLNRRLWNIWAWMAKSLDDYMWGAFIDSFEPIVFTIDGNNRGLTVPASDVCVWVLEESRAKGDWATVIRYAKNAEQFYGYLSGGASRSWLPNGWTGTFVSTENPGSYPMKSAYALHFEALLRLGRIDDANALFDKMARVTQPRTMPMGHLLGRARSDFKSPGAIVAAETARSLGMEELAVLWEKGEQINKVPYFSYITGLDWQPFFVLHADFGKSPVEKGTFWSEFTGRARTGNAVFEENVIKFHDTSKNVYPALGVSLTGGGDMASLGWKKDDGFRWALVDYGRDILAQGVSVPDQGELQSILKRLNTESLTDKIRRYNAEQGNLPGLGLRLAVEVINGNYSDFSNNEKVAPTDDNGDMALWGEASRLLNRVLNEQPEIMININPVNSRNISVQSQTLKLLSRPMLANIESLLEKKPSSEALWHQWIFWKGIEGEKRPMAPVAERVKISPISTIKDMLPPRIMQIYLDDCKSSGDWDRVIGLLRTVWDREFTWLSASDEEGAFSGITVATIGDMLGTHLMEAYLNGDMPSAANEIFGAVMACGGKFSDISKMAELARAKGQERLAKEWEDGAKK
jgi:hypothetical protein